MTDQPDLRSIGIQCNLLEAPPLQKLETEQDYPSDSKAESITSDPEDTDLDTSFQIIQEDTTTE